MTRYHVGLVNVPIKVGPKSWSKCWRIMAGASDVFGVNESLSRRQRSVYTVEARLRGWGHAGLFESPNPLFFDRGRWRKVRGTTRVVKIHGPGPWRQWPGYGAARYYTFVLLDHRETGQRHAFINWHGVPNGPKVEPQWRGRVRAQSKVTLRDLVADMIDEQLPVWLIGDTNIVEPFDMGRGFTWIRPHGVDKIGVGLPPGYTLDGHGVRMPAVPSDHKRGIVARVEITTKETA